MGRKEIPFHLREFLERQIVRGSRGYESVERVLSSISESDLRGFLTLWESSYRDQLLDMSHVEQKTTGLDEIARRLASQDVDDEPDKFNKLLASVRKEEE